MPGPLTETEMAQIKDHGNWGGGEVPAAYVQVYVDPTLQHLANEAHLAVIREHLAELNSIYAQLKAAKEDFGLDEAKGIKFSRANEGRLWGMYKFWREKLYQQLDLNINTEPRGSGRRRRSRGIR